MYKPTIKPENCRYIISPERRVVICIIENTSTFFEDFILTNFDIYLNSIKWWASLKMPQTFFGVAYCSPEDEWNPEFGKLLAYSRARYKLNKSFFKRANTYINNLDTLVGEAVDTFNAYGEKLTRNAARREEKIKRVIGEPEGEDS